MVPSPAPRLLPTMAVVATVAVRTTEEDIMAAGSTEEDTMGAAASVEDITAVGATTAHLPLPDPPAATGETASPTTVRTSADLFMNNKKARAATRMCRNMALTGGVRG